MKGKIDQEGDLFIYRGKESKLQRCSFYGSVSGTWENLDYVKDPCGDECPLFGEPVITEPSVEFFSINGFKTEKKVRIAGNTKLLICQDRTLEFEEFTDERVKNEAS